MEETLRQRDPVAGTKLIVGLFFTIAGLLLTADNLDLFDAERVLRYWPAVIVLIGVLKLADAGSRMLGVILTGAGLWLLALNAGWVHVSIFDLWPLLLIIFGIGMVGRALGLRGPEGAAPREGNNGWAVLSNRKIASSARDFRGARVAALLGAVELDLTGADIVQSPAVVECFVMWGGIEIYVPETWEIAGEVVPIMAGFEVRTAAAADPQRQLIVRGTALMGGIEVKRRTP